jgi:uncharacterized protein YqhQ
MDTIGGQAVIEGVMLRRKNFYSLAVRQENGEIHTERHRIKDYRKGKLGFLKLPFLRGLYSMYEMMSIGVKTLIRSTNLAMSNSEKEEKLSFGELFLTICFSVLFAIGIFVLLPYIFTSLLGFNEQTRPILFNFIDAIIKILIFIGYVFIISLMPDIKRVFQYHGAEHKVVHCYESGKKLIYANIKKFPTIHCRCGSSFIMLTIFVSILVFSFLPLLLQTFFPIVFELNIFLTKTILGLLRIIFLPVVIMVSYELLKLAGKYEKNFLIQIINYPGHLLQKITTAEPDKKQVEVAIASLNILLKR